MENEPTTKTPIPTHRASLFWILSPASCLLPYPPIPTRSGFRNFALCTLIFAFSIILRSTLVEPPLQITLFSAKQTQFPHAKNQCKPLCRKELHQYSALRRPRKTNPIEPNSSPKLELCSTLSEVEGPIKPNSPAPHSSSANLAVALMPSINYPAAT